MSDFKFQRLKFKIYGKSDKDMLELLQPLEVRFQPLRTLKKSPHYLALMRYLLYLYDPGTDLNQEYVRLEDRKQAASSLSGLIKIQDLAYVDQVIDNTYPDTLEVIQILLTEVFHDRKYREWQTLQNELDEYTKARWDPIEATKSRKTKDEIIQVSSGQTKATLEALTLKTELRQACADIQEKLDRIEREIFGDHRDVKELAYKSRFINPESFARAMRQVV